MKSGPSKASPVSTNTGCCACSTYEFTINVPTPGMSRCVGSTVTSPTRYASSMIAPCQSSSTSGEIDRVVERQGRTLREERVDCGVAQILAQCVDEAHAPGRLAAPHRDTHRLALAV